MRKSPGHLKSLAPSYQSRTQAYASLDAAKLATLLKFQSSAITIAMESVRECERLKPRGDLGSAATEVQFRPLTVLAADLQFSPAYAAADARTEGFGPCFLGGEARGQALCIVLAGEAVGDLARGEYAFEK
jgi:hypothetical protein